MQKVFDRLLTIKSIVTIMLTIVFCILALCGTIDGGQFLTIFTVVIGFYFGTQSEKRAKAEQAAKAVEPVANVVIEDMAVQSAVDAAVHKETRPPDESEDVVIAGFAG